jgi:phosphatidylglycerophosphate synthase
MEIETRPDRRPLASRSTSWAALATRLLLRTPITANQVSLAGLVFSALGGLALAVAPGRPLAYLAAAVAVQLRLLSNMLDGMVAVEGRRFSYNGALFNEVPDRFEDSVFLIAAGYAAGLDWLGYLAALFAVITAYVRVLGASLGFPQDFRGPMAKPQRMAALTLGCLGAFAEGLISASAYVLQITLIVVTTGTLLTAARRLVAISAQLKDRQP